MPIIRTDERFDKPVTRKMALHITQPPHLCLWKEIEVGEEIIIMEKEHRNMATILLCISSVVLAR